MRKIAALVEVELKRMLIAKSTYIYAVIYFASYIISAVYFKLYGTEGSVLKVGNTQSFPIQHLQTSYLTTGIFLAIYVAYIIIQERTKGTIKLVLLRSISRMEYYMSKIISIFLFSVLLTLMMIILSYIVGMLFFGWGTEMVFGSLTASGLKGVLWTLFCGLAFSFAYFAFGLLVMVVSMFVNQIMGSVVIMGGVLIFGEYAEIFPAIKQFIIFHQMIFFHADIFEKSASYNLISAFVIGGYCLAFSVLGYLVFRKKDLIV
jgi:ABC-type transport system involved in multi-copper enzyme maturation permease subunit